MSFKYLYCFDDFRRRHREKFENCHIPLDSFTLNWYKDNIILNKNKSKKNNAKKISKIEYEKITSNIKEKLSSGYRTTNYPSYVLNYEFKIWRQYKIKYIIDGFVKLDELDFDLFETEKSDLLNKLNKIKARKY